jgi:hypothetical protein
MEWVKERIFSYRIDGEPNPEKRIHCRLRSDGRAYFQVVTVGGRLDDRESLEEKFAHFLAASPERDGMTEEEFNENFERNREHCEGVEVQNWTPFANLRTCR